jgi:hypothetical protein
MCVRVCVFGKEKKKKKKRVCPVCVCARVVPCVAWYYSAQTRSHSPLTSPTPQPFHAKHTRTHVAEQFNLPLFRQLGDLGLLGLTVDPEYGGSGMDAAAVAVAHEELSAADPAFCLSYLAHSLLFVNNLAQVCVFCLLLLLFLVDWLARWLWVSGGWLLVGGWVGGVVGW